MDVLLVTAVVGGGVGRHVQQLCRGLSACGHRVVVACPASVADQFRLAEHGARVEPLELGSRPSPRADLAAIRRLRALARPAQVVHAHGMRAGGAAALARGRGAPPLVVTLHNAVPEGPSGWVYAALETAVLRRADLVLGVSPDLVDRAASRGRPGLAVDLAVVPADARPLDEIARRDARAGLRAALGLPPEGGPGVVLAAGRLSAQKRLDRLVRAHQLIDGRARGRGEDPPVLVLAGDGPQLPDLRELIGRGSGDVRLLGHREDVPVLMAGADVVVSTSGWEGQPLGLQEALAAGAAIVATDVGGTAVVLGGAGRLVDGAEDGVVERVARAVEEVLEDPSLAADLRRAALARAARLPTVDDAVEAALTAYRWVLREPTGSGHVD